MVPDGEANGRRSGVSAAACPLGEEVERNGWPRVCHWTGPDNPLPVRAVRAPARPRTLGLDAPPWLPTGPEDRPFDFCGHIRRLCADIARRCETLAHVDVSRLLFAVTQARSNRVR